MVVKSPKGTKDIFGQEMNGWHYVETVIREVCKDFGFGEIRTPIFEHTELFIRGVGDTTDVVQKQMYTFDDLSKKSISLRPEGTAGVARAFIEHSMFGGVQPTKLYYLGPNFRYEQPQFGRQRQFHQFGVESLGSYHAAADAEAISLAYEIYRRLGLKEVKLHINNLGGPECRVNYNRALKEFIAANVDSLCHNCKERYERNPLRVLDCKEESCKKIIEGAPSVLDYLCDECRKHLEDLKSCLTTMGIPFEIDEKIVRGLDYYTRTVFEFISYFNKEEGLTLCGGGRYDNLIEECGGPKTGAVGFAMGMERILLALETQGKKPTDGDKAKIFVGAIGEEAFLKTQALVYSLRKVGIAAEGDLLQRSVKAQMRYADKIAAEFSTVLGEDEFKNNKLRLKEMVTGEQFEIPELTAEAIAKFLQSK